MSTDTNGNEGTPWASLSDVLDIWMLRAPRMFRSEDMAIRFLESCVRVAHGKEVATRPPELLAAGGFSSSVENAKRMKSELDLAVARRDG